MPRRRTAWACSFVMLAVGCTGELVGGDTDDALEDDGLAYDLAPEGAALVLYLAVDGDDANDGLTRQSPLATIAGAQDWLYANLPTMDRNVEIRIEPGTYRGQGGIAWSYSSAEHTVSFMPVDFEWGVPYPVDAVLPRFEGHDYCDTRTGEAQCKFLQVAHDGAGRMTNVRFYLLDIRHYLTAGIVFGKNGHAWNGGNVVFRCRFQELGTSFFPGHGGPGYDAIGVHDSRENRIEKNRFIDLVNSPGEEKFIHAVYLSHDASQNLITGNRVVRVTGAPMKVRDYSNDNVFEDNVFRRAGDNTIFLDWIDSHDECFSWQNVFRNNSLGCGYHGAAVPTTRLRTDFAQGERCQNRSPRVTTSGNTSTCD